MSRIAHGIAYGIAHVGTLALAILFGIQTGHGQSQTTGTLHLRNSQAQQISLTLPAAGVAPYTLQLPSEPGVGGQTLTVSALAGSVAELAWTDSPYWGLQGSAITAGGTGADEQFLGTANAQDLVLAANSREVMRIVGIAGASQGYVGFGTSTPQAPYDFTSTVLLSSRGAASELRFAEPAAAGSEFTAIRAGEQSASITYTLPPSLPAQSGYVLTTTSEGELSWVRPFTESPMGVYVPTPDAWQHSITVGSGVLTAASVPVVTLISTPGSTIGITVTGIDAATGTLDVETSVPLTASDRIAWAIFNP